MSGAIPIRAPADITPGWMTDVLRHAGIDATVVGLTSKRVGTGQVGESYRFNLAYAEGAPTGPATLVGKFPASDPVSRSAGVDFGNYFREVSFYRQLKSTALVTTPHCLFTDVDPVSHDFVLMMEDLAPASPGDQTKGISLAQTELGLAEAAKLHASHWNDPAINEMGWISDTQASAQPLGGDVIAQLWKGFLERYGDRVQPHCVPIGEAVVANYAKFKYGYTGPRCLTHNDFRPDNMMFGTEAGGRAITVLDWQSLGWGCCMADVAYFLAGAISPDERRVNEDRLLRDYHARLTSLGVSGYSFDQMMDDYAHYSFALFNMGFTASMVVERTTRGDDMFFQMLESGAELVQDLNAVERLQRR